MDYSLTVTEAHWQSLIQQVLQDEKERMAFAYVNDISVNNGKQYLIKSVDLPKDEEYRFHGSIGVSLKAEMAIPRIFNARNFSGFIDIHSHPFSHHPYPSVTDEIGSISQLSVLKDLAPGTDLIRIIVGKGGEIWAVVIPYGKNVVKSISQVIILGENRRQVIYPVNSSPRFLSVPNVSNIDDQEVRTKAVLGSGCQDIRLLKVLVIGTGGTGSAVVSQLRGYINDLTLVDPDVVETHNAPRLYAYSHGDDGLAKVKIHEREIQRAFPHVKVHSIADAFPSPETLDAFKEADIVFCCPDHNAVRYAVAQAANRYLKPVIEIGCGGKRTDGKISALGYHVRLQVPGFACLACNGLDLRSLEDPTTTEMKQRIGYIENGDLIQGELISLTTRAASDAVDLFFRYITGYVAQVPHHIYFDALNFKTMDLTTAYHSHPNCPICGEGKASLFAVGDNLTEEQKILPSPTEIS